MAKATKADQLPRAYTQGVYYVVQLCRHSYIMGYRRGKSVNWYRDVSTDTGERWRHQWFVKNGYTQIDLGELAEL